LDWLLLKRIKRLSEYPGGVKPTRGKLKRPNLQAGHMQDATGEGEFLEMKEKKVFRF
jgi:hypothetical protein